MGYRNSIPHKKYQTKPKPLRYKADAYPSPVTMGIHTISPETWAYHKSRNMGIPQSRYHGHTTSPVTMGIPQVPLPWAYHSPVIKGIPQVPLPWAFIPQVPKQGHTTSPVTMGIPYRVPVLFLFFPYGFL